MSDPEISIIICTYNRASSLISVLEDLRNQEITERAFSWELVLVDNNSTDSTREVVESYKKRKYLPIEYVFERMQGKSFALNAGVKAARANLLVFTDDDVVLDRYWLSSVHEAFTKYPHNCFGGRVLPVMEGTFPSWLSAEDKKYRIYGGPIVTHDRGDQVKEYDETMYVPIGSNMFIRKKMFEKYGYFNTELGFYSNETLIYGEDSEIMLRFKYRGEAILYYPHAVVKHPAPMERLKKSYFKKWCWGAARGKARSLEIGPGTRRYLNIPRYLIRELLEEAFRCLLVIPGGKEYKKFYHEMQLLYKLGMIYEFYINGN